MRKHQVMPLVYNLICNVTHLRFIDSAPKHTLIKLHGARNPCRHCMISQCSEAIVVQLAMTTAQAILGSSAICDLRGCSQSISYSSKTSIKQLQPSRRSPALKAHPPAVLRLHTNLRMMPRAQSKDTSSTTTGITEILDPDNSRKEVFEAAANNILEEYESNQEGEIPSDSNGKTSTNGKSTKSKEQEIDWENVPTLPGELDIAQRHPLDPHKPNYSELLPEGLRPYPSFEGWFIRLWDPKTEFSAAVIMATNYATDESQVTLLFAPGKDSDKRKNGEIKPDADRDSVRFGYTYAVAVKIKDAKFSEKENDQQWGENRGEEPEGFEWEANGVGKIVVTPHTTDLDFTVEGYTFKAHLTNELLWDAQKSEKGPEGWVRYVSIIPTHWYVYSLGSTADYSFSNTEKNITNEGIGYAHVEKNWGQTFPAGHVWLQAFSADNTSQVCCAGAYFKTPNEKLSSPHLFVLGYRTPTLQLDFRTNDLGIVFKDIHFSPLESRFSITAVGPWHTMEVSAHAPYDTFSDPVLAPVTKADWEPACREFYVATVEVKVYEHLAWGIPGTSKLVGCSNLQVCGS